MKKCFADEMTIHTFPASRTLIPEVSSEASVVVSSAADVSVVSSTVVSVVPVTSHPAICSVIPTASNAVIISFFIPFSPARKFFSFDFNVTSAFISTIQKRTVPLRTVLLILNCKNYQLLVRIANFNVACTAT